MRPIKAENVLKDEFGNVQTAVPTYTGKVNPAVSQELLKQLKPTSSGGSTGGSAVITTSPNEDYYNRLMAAIEAQKEASRNKQYAALDAQLKQGLSNYDAQLKSLDPVYQGYRNQSEVQRYKAQDSLREALANRGALDSGAGRQEMLDLNTNYGNNLNSINMQYQSEVDAINRAKQALQDEANLQKTQIASDLEIKGLDAKIAALQSMLNNQKTTTRVSGGGSSGGTDNNAKLSDSGKTFYDSMQRQAKAYKRNLTANEIQEGLRSGYNQGLLNEQDVKLIRSYYNI